MLILQYLNDHVSEGDYRLQIGVIEILIGMLIWPLSLLIFIRSILNR